MHLTKALNGMVMLDSAYCCRISLVLSITLVHCAGSTPRGSEMISPAQQRNLVHVSGKIVGQRENSIVPLPNALVALVSADDSGNNWLDAATVATTDVHGDFSFETAAGNYRLTSSAADFVAQSIPLSVDYTYRTPPIALRLEPATSDTMTLKGSIIDAVWKPQAGARVVARRLDAGDGALFVVAANDEGEFHMAVPRGRYAIAARKETLHSRELILPADTINQHWTSLIVVPNFDSPAPPAVVDWLRQRASSLGREGNDIRLDDADAIVRLVGNARVVGLGESSHGGHEFAQTKVRIFQLLAQKAGFTIFAIEASGPECADIDRYVQGGSGDPALLLYRLRFWITDINELLELIQWMRAYNADRTHPQKLHFAGVDMQYAPRATEWLLQYMTRVDPTLARRVKPELHLLASEFETENFSRQPQSIIDRATAATAELAHALEQHRDAYSKRDSAEAWSRAATMARTLSRYLRLQACRQPGCTSPNDMRDQFMADHALELLHDQPKARMTLWAANAHVATAQFVDWEHPLGHDLRQALGKDYLAIGFSFSGGVVKGYGDNPVGEVADRQVEPALAGSVDETCARVGLQAFLVDLRGAQAEVADWLAAKHRTHDMGPSYGAPSDEFELMVSLSDAYDALIYIDNITPIHLRHPRSIFWPVLNPEPENLKFTSVADTDHAPAGWILAPRSKEGGYRSRTVVKGGINGRSCVLIDRTGPDGLPGYGSLTQDLDATAYRGHGARLSANVRVEAAANPLMPHEAQLWATALANDGRRLGFVAMPEQPITSETWQRYSVTLNVPEATARIRFGIAVEGDTRVRVDDVEFERID